MEWKCFKNIYYIFYIFLFLVRNFKNLFFFQVYFELYLFQYELVYYIYIVFFVDLVDVEDIEIRCYKGEEQDVKKVIQIYRVLNKEGSVNVVF